MARTFVVCVSNEGFEASLERHKVYRSLSDPQAERDGLIRVVDESGEDYLYPESMFEPIEAPQRLVDSFSLAS